ncbi:hypothetical protein F5Y10DRAFT_255074 [Nemania abortiva]|nr:hypothetical protein F5Y10DRAFT_255074 [Nemania abortiva]
MAGEFFATAPLAFKGYDITEDQLSTMETCIRDEVTVEDAAKRLTEHTAAASSPLEVQQRLSGLWTLLNDTAVALPSAQSRIIAILQSIRKLPKLDVPRGEGEYFIDLDDGFVWRELTGWANNWADTYNYHGSRFVIESYSPEEHAARKACWINANAYTARLAATGEPELTSYGAALDRASRVIVEALEVDHGENKPAQLEAAAELFKHAAAELYRRSQQKSHLGSLVSLRTNRDGKSPTREQFHDAEGYSMDIWNAWKRMWEFFSAQPSSSEEARAASYAALMAMREAES